jgi:hypothetical protein
MTPADRDAAVALARDLQQVEHEIRTVALVEWGWPESSPRQAAMRRWASVLRDVLDAISTCDWQPIATAPKDVKCWFWLRARTVDDPHYVTTSGSPILLECEPHALVCEYGHWSSLLVATHWQPYHIPAPPAPSVTCSICRRDDCGGDHPCE